MATISSPGIGSSNYDLSGLLNQLQAFELQALKPIESAQKATQTRITAYGTLSSAVSTLQSAAAKLGQPAAFGAVKTSVTGEAFTASASAGAAVGQYQIHVHSLAQAHVLQSAATDRDEPLGQAGDSLTIELTDGTRQTITLGEDTTLRGVVKAINGNDKSGVSATLINGEDNTSVLMLSAKASGTQKAIARIEVTGGTQLRDTLAYTASTPPEAGGSAGSAMTQQTAAQDARLEINGIVVRSAGNVVTDAVDGLSLTLLKPTEPGATERLSITSDTSASSSAVSSFVSAYNNLLTVMGNLTRYNPATGTSSTLTADGTTRSVQDGVAAALRFVTDEGDLRSLGQIGVTTNPSDGKLVIDQTKLADALKSQPADVARIFAGPGGLSERMAQATEQILGDGKGLKGSIGVRTDSLAEQEKAQGKQLESAQLRVEATMRTYEAQFTTLSVSLSRFESTQNYLTNQFDLMAKTK